MHFTNIDSTTGIIYGLILLVIALAYLALHYRLNLYASREREGILTETIDQYKQSVIGYGRTLETYRKELQDELLKYIRLRDQYNQCNEKLILYEQFVKLSNGRVYVDLSSIHLTYERYTELIEKVVNEFNGSRRDVIVPVPAYLGNMFKGSPNTVGYIEELTFEPVKNFGKLDFVLKSVMLNNAKVTQYTKQS